MSGFARGGEPRVGCHRGQPPIAPRDGGTDRRDPVARVVARGACEPGLRGVAQTAPYMHNGVYRTLEQVVLELTGPSADRVDGPGQASRAYQRGRAAESRGSGRPDDRGSGEDQAGRTDPAGGRGSGWPDAYGPGADQTGRTERADGSRP